MREIPNSACRHWGVNPGDISRKPMGGGRVERSEREGVSVGLRQIQTLSNIDENGSRSVAQSSLFVSESAFTPQAFIDKEKEVTHPNGTPVI